MNFFYASHECWNDEKTIVELKDQEATHISRVLRYKAGEEIFVADGMGNHCRCIIKEITKRSVLAEVTEINSSPEPAIKKVMAFGAIKKRDRLEFAIEKAVELDAWEICIFDADHSERSRLNEDRLLTQIVSAFKQSGRYFLPKLVIKDSLDKVIDHYNNHSCLMAYLGSEEAQRPKELAASNNLLLVGPEGGFSKREANLVKEKKGSYLSLGKNRLRAETAVAAFLSQYI